jgi:hypothetical protein
MRTMRMGVLILMGMIAIGVGCRKNAVDKGAFKTALNNYYSSRQECLWNAPVKFPAQADTSNEDQTKGFDALTDAGMLTRKSAEKKRFLIGSKQVNDYDLSDKGRTVWVADSTQPGFGNFCFGRLEVTAVDSYTPPDGDATQYSVSYHDAVSNPPAWAGTPEMKTAFPKIASDTNGQQMATATLTKSSDGWMVSNVAPTTTSVPAPATP